MSEYKQYRRTAIAEMADWHEGFDMTGVSISEVDKVSGSPKLGDRIARNPKNHADRWLVAEAYFRDNFAPIGQDALRTIAEQLAEALVTTEGFINTHFHMSPPDPKDCKRCRLPHDTKAALVAWKEWNRES